MQLHFCVFIHFFATQVHLLVYRIPSAGAFGASMLRRVINFDTYSPGRRSAIRNRRADWAFAEKSPIERKNAGAVFFALCIRLNRKIHNLLFVYKISVFFE